jgi:hypothetical protein
MMTDEARSRLFPGKVKLVHGRCATGVMANRVRRLAATSRGTRAILAAILRSIDGGV